MAAVPAPTDTNILLRRKIELRVSEWTFSIDLIGDLVTSNLEPGAKLFIVGAKKSAYMCMQTVETTRLSYIIQDADWFEVQPAELDTPVRKAMRMESLAPTSIRALGQAPDDEARCVDATMVPLTGSLFEERIWCGALGDRMRLSIALRDDSGTVHATLWSSEFTNIINHNVDELGVMFAECEQGDAEKQAFIEALNENADTVLRWVLRPKVWRRENGDSTNQWNVASVNTP